MQYKTLGNTGLLVSNLCFGTMTFAGSTGFWKAIGTVDQAGADELIKASVAAGINFFDTADVYAEGESEKTLGQSIRNLGIARKDIVIASKVFGRVGPGRNDVGASRGHIMDAVEASLRRLQTDYIDLYQIHGNDSVTPVEETLRALDTLAHQHLSDPESLEELARLFPLAESVGVQTAIAGVLIRSDYKAFAKPELVQTLQRHRLPSSNGADLIDVLIRRLQAQ